MLDHVLSAKSFICKKINMTIVTNSKKEKIAFINITVVLAKSEL